MATNKDRSPDENRPEGQNKDHDRQPDNGISSEEKLSSSEGIGAAEYITIELAVDEDVLKTVEQLEETFGTDAVNAVKTAQRNRGEDEREFSRLSEKQATALRTAHEKGYFDRPRQNSATEIAESLGVTHSTFLRRLRAAEKQVFERSFQ